RSNRQSVAVKVGEGIPEKEDEADHHKHDEQKGIYAVARGNLFLILIPAGVLCQTYKAGQPEYQVKNSQQQQDTQTNNKSYHVYSRFLDMVMQTFFQHGMIPSDERHPGKRVEHNQEKGSQENQCGANFKESNTSLLLHDRRRHHVVKIEPVSDQYNGTHQFQR